MNKYKVDDLTKGVFAEPITIEAKSPKEAAEKRQTQRLSVIISATLLSMRRMYRREMGKRLSKVLCMG